MNAVLNINVRVAAAQARAAMKQVEQDLTRMQRMFGGAAGGAASLNAAMNPARLSNFGKNLQWTGRQLEFNFTLPLLLAGGAATKWALDNERAMVQVRKVYGDGSEGPEQLRGELDALSKSFELLSNRFGMNQAEVIEIGGAWAQAGSAGVGLANSVRLTMETMILGQMDAAKATESLIGIQSVFQLSTEQLRNVVADLNIVENQTAIGMSELVDVLTRAGGTARTAGVDIRELVAMAAAIVPAAGSGAQAGNALRTIISRIMAPTRETTELLRKMNIEVTSAGWQSQDAFGRIETLAAGFGQLSDAQKTVVSSSVASRWQLNRFDILMQAVSERTGFFRKALDITSDGMDRLNATTSKARDTMERELLVALESSPQRLAMLTTILKNTLTQAIQPLIPYIIILAQKVTQMAQAFSKLSPEAKLMIVAFLTMVAAIGPLVRILGAFAVLLGGIGSVLKFVGGLILPLFLNPWVAAIAAVVAVIGAFVLWIERNVDGGIRGVMQNIEQRLTRLPGVFGEAFAGVFRVVRAVVAKIVEILSYINPFARHSPSMVDNVTAGVTAILNQYSRLRNIPGILKTAQNALENFNAATAGGQARARAAEQTETRTKIVEFDPGAGPAVDNLYAALNRLYPALDAIGLEVAAQELTVERWEEAVRQANLALDVQERLLGNLQTAAQAARDQMDAAVDEMDRLRDMPLQGWHAMEDAIFSNEMAQKRLRLEILRMEEAGQSVEDIQQKMADLQGAIDQLRGESLALRQAGAGSDVLGPIEDQIAAMEASRNALMDAGSPINELQKQLEDLQRQGEILDLESALQFDPLRRQIDQVGISMQEMPFDELYAALQGQQTVVDNLTTAWEAADAAATAQAAVVDAQKVARDALAATYDAEKDRLESLRAAYSAVNDQINAMESALRTLEQAADAADRRLKDTRSQAEQLFDAAQGHDFADIGGTSGIGREGGLAEIEAFNKQMEEEINKALGRIGEGMDIFGPIKDKWNEFKDWLGKSDIGGAIGPAFDAAGGVIARWLTDNDIPGTIMTGLTMLSEWSTIFIEMFRPGFEAFGKMFGETWDKATKVIGGELQKWGPLVRDGIEAIRNVILVVMAAIVVIWNALWPVLLHVVKPIFDGIIGIIKAALQLVRGVLQFFFSLFTGDFVGAGQAILTVIDALWDAIYAVFATAFGIVIGIVRGLIETIVGFFQGLWDILVGNSIIPDMVDAIIAVFRFLWEMGKAIWQGLVDAIIFIVNLLVAGIRFALDAIMFVWNSVWNTVKSVAVAIWDGIKNAIIGTFNTIKGALESIGNTIRSIWSGLWEGIKNVASGIWQGIQTGWDTFIGGLRGAFEGAVTALGNIWNGLKSVLAKPINWIIENVINKFFKGIERIAGALQFKLELPRIDPIPEMHTGGVVGRDSSGRGNPGALAQDEVIRILQKGEGVVPREIMRRIGTSGFERLRQGETDLLPETGGPFDWVADRANDVINVGRKVIAEVVEPVIKAAIKNLDGVGREFGVAGGLLTAPPRMLGNTVLDWIGGVESEAKKRVGTIPEAAGMPFNRLIAYMAGTGVPHRVTSTFRPGSITASGNLSRHAQGLAVDLAGPTSGWDSPALAAIFKAFEPIESQLNELIYAGPQVSYNIKRGQRVGKYAQDLHHDHVHAALRNGGIVLARSGGTTVRAGEGGRDEAVIPLPNAWRSGEGMGKKEYHFHGDLSFPNIRSGEDAEEFVRNLDRLVRD